MAKKEWYQQPAFLKERRRWYKKLEKEGFQDAEVVDWKSGEEGNLLRGYGSYGSIKDYQRNWSPDKERYFTYLRQRSWDMKKEGYNDDECEAVRLVGEGETLKFVGKLLGFSRAKLKDLLDVQIRKAAWEDTDDD
jgi:hypothetical protein